MEISDEVVEVAVTAFMRAKGLTHNQMKTALQAAIPLVVKGLVGDEACATQAPVHLTTSEAACWSWGMNKRRNDILAKVKK